MSIKTIIKEYVQDDMGIDAWDNTGVYFDPDVDYESLKYKNVQKGDVLIIHPDDRTTDFLKPCYEGIDATIITHPDQMYNLQETVANHNRIIMMGHGSPYGLFLPLVEGVEENENGEYMPYYTYSIDDEFAQILKDKRIAAIWCNADGYVVPHDLHGFYTGMAISELCEAEYCGVKGCDKNQMEESNTKFTMALKEALKVDGPESVNIFKEIYHNPNNPIMVYNRQRIYFR
jgi:hypothetical protein